MKDLDNPTLGPVHLQIFCPYVIRGPWFVPGLNVCDPSQQYITYLYVPSAYCSSYTVGNCLAGYLGRFQKNKKQIHIKHLP